MLGIAHERATDYIERWGVVQWQDSGFWNRQSWFESTLPNVREAKPKPREENQMKMRVEIKVLGPIGDTTLSSAVLELNIEDALKIQHDRGLCIAAWVKACAEIDMDAVLS